MPAYSIAEARARLSEIIERVSAGEEVVLTKRGHPIARVVSIRSRKSILGAGVNDQNINHAVIAKDEWWQPLSGAEAAGWYE